MKKFLILPILLIIGSSALSQSRELVSSARNGNTNSQVELATMLLQHLNENYNPLLAVEWLDIAISRGNLDAKYVLGEAMLFGKAPKAGSPPQNTIARDRERGLRLMKEAADAGNAQALNHLGVMYYHGGFLKKDIKKSEEYLNAAIKKGSGLARQNYNFLFIEKNPYNSVDDLSPRK